MKSGFEVFEFGEADKQTDRADVEFLSKFKNPNLQMTHCQVDKCDADTIECDGQGNNPTASTLMVGMDLDDSERNSGQDGAAPHINPLVNGQDCRSKIDYCHSASSLVDLEERIPCCEVPSLEKAQLNGPLPNSLLNSEVSTNEGVADDNIVESDPVRFSPAVAARSAVAADIPSTNCFDSLQMDEAEVCIAVDYVVYQKKYSTGCTVVFSRDNIKISSLAASEEDHETGNLEKSIDDIVHIGSERLERFETVSVKLHILSKVAGNIDGTSGVEELEFVIGEPDWSRKCQQIKSLNEKYTSLWTVHDIDILDEVDSLQRKKYFPDFERSFEDVIYPEGDCDAVSISKRDVDLLEPETFINDTIIDFYIQYLKNQIPPEEKHKYHFFNSFFFRKLADLDKDPSSALDGRAAFLRVRKWTRKVDIFGKDYIFIPVNFGLHWSLLVICHPGKIASFTDAEFEKSPGVPCILHMDSIKGTHAGLKNLIQSYLWEEWTQRQEETSKDVYSNFMNLRFVALELPQQENSFDCGLFLLHYLELFLSEAPVNFNLFNINKFSKFLSWDWFLPVEASLKRTLIQKLISELLENRTKVVSSGDDGCKEQINSQDGCIESSVDIVAKKDAPSIGGHRNSSSFQAGQGIGMTLLETSSMRNAECVGDPSMVVRELVEPGVGCSSFDQSSSYYQLNGAVGPVEGDAENGFMDFDSGDAVFHQIDMPSHAGFSRSFSLQGFAAETSGKEEVEDSSAESSSANSDGSDIGIIENCSLANGDVRQKEELFKQTCPLLDDNMDSHASTSADILETETRDTEGAEAYAINLRCDSHVSREEKRSISVAAELPLEQTAMNSELNRDASEKEDAGAGDVTAVDKDAHLEAEEGVVEVEEGEVEGKKNNIESNTKRNAAEVGVAADETALKRVRISEDEAAEIGCV